jgi:hypothetical protein
LYRIPFYKKCKNKKGAPFAMHSENIEIIEKGKIAYDLYEPCRSASASNLHNRMQWKAREL